MKTRRAREEFVPTLEPPNEAAADSKFPFPVDNKPAAVKRVCELTGVGLRVSKDFVDGLQ